ncbi:hypothetical protein [uncultured Flavobacterium sp.]|uniref:hypothetical protein n=1 Tax=uncultured Flavobacterium sp. TaxID=165435 RepID=UPI0025EEA36F|nr:hypothetical protein [uncultured Flavobacterium sp.]
MKTKLLYLLLLSALVSCTSDDGKANNGNDGSYFEISVNGENLSLPRSTFTANENCGNIFAGVMDIPSRFSIRFNMQFRLTDNGKIHHVRFTEYSDNNRHYETVVFKPAETFSISNFNYDKTAGRVHFEYEGDLYEMGHPENKKHISGKMQHNSTASLECGFFPRTVQVNDTEMNFTSWVVNSSSAGFAYDNYSDNGYVLRLTTETDIENLAPGSYPFTPESPLRINLYKYIGETKADFDTGIYPAEWSSYNCSGTLTIDTHNTLPYPHTTGTFSLHATDNEGNTRFENLTGSFKL